ncbi:adenine nucleotide alpha hydrolase [Ferrimonas balearica]|uniref:adenine nucleotide alpha hydrolase n=1 Tax=Ferrimonas balearica TaxID=44012 RepID=UPI001F357437|nr:adenine nucleotide alpha hydrolase [Ferrimonas balearica]MBY6094209.1 adenine nucleotide alpha hydrolase [Ferrimonas balearica]
MNQPRPTLLSWSSGKDSAWALHQLRQDPSVNLKGIFTTVNAEVERVAIHGVRQSLLRNQAEALGLPLYTIDLPYPCSNDDYQAAMSAFHQWASEQGIECIAFGDLFLEDVRDYRIQTLEGTGLTPLFPLWGSDTTVLSHTMIKAGLKARISCIQNDKLPRHCLGQSFDFTLLDNLPATIDPCGENGEFHTFCYDGPMFRHPIPVQCGEEVVQEFASFIDLLPIDDR